MKPLVRRTSNGRRYLAPATPTNGHDGGAKATPPQRREPRAKLTEDDVREARAMHAAGRFGVNDLAYIFGVTQPTMSAVIGRHTWKHVEDEP
jgi:hypothetical protein